MDWKQLLVGIVIGAVLGIAGTFFLFQGRLSKLETKIEMSTTPTKQTIDTADKNRIITANDPTAYSITISTPRNDEVVDQAISVAGKATGEYRGHIWLVVHHLNTLGWWPQAYVVPNKSDGNWMADILVGVPKDQNKSFEIEAVIADTTAHESFIDYLKKCKETNSYPEVPLPPGTTVIDKVVVRRR